MSHREALRFRVRRAWEQDLKRAPQEEDGAPDEAGLPQPSLKR
jgi:hypothetical protein